MPMYLSDDNSCIPYNFPFYDYVNYLMSFFRSIRVKNYLRRWNNVFTMLDEQCALDMLQFQRNRYDFPTDYETYGFQFDVDAVSAVYIYNFDVENLKERAQHYEIKSYPTELLIRSAVYNNDESHSTHLTTPIILYPLRTNGYKFIVVDGNKRLTYAEKNRIEYIDAVVIDSIQRSDFFSAVDWAMLLCTEEVNNILANRPRYFSVISSVLNNKNFKSELNKYISQY